MKLRTRIILVSGMTVLAVCLVSDAIIWHLTGKSYQNEAYAKAYQNTYVIATQLEQGISEYEWGSTESTYVEYFLKTQSDNYNVCFRYNIQADKLVERIYNHTIFEHCAEGESYKQWKQKEIKLSGGFYIGIKGRPDERQLSGDSFGERNGYRRQ